MTTTHEQSRREAVSAAQGVSIDGPRADRPAGIGHQDIGAWFRAAILTRAAQSENPTLIMLERALNVVPRDEFAEISRLVFEKIERAMPNDPLAGDDCAHLLRGTPYEAAMEASQLAEKWEGRGVIVTIERRSVPPLSAGNHRPRVQARLSRARYQALDNAECD